MVLHKIGYSKFQMVGETVNRLSTCILVKNDCTSINTSIDCIASLKRNFDQSGPKTPRNI